MPAFLITFFTSKIGRYVLIGGAIVAAFSLYLRRRDRRVRAEVVSEMVTGWQEKMQAARERSDKAAAEAGKATTVDERLDVLRKNDGRW